MKRGSCKILTHNHCYFKRIKKKTSQNHVFEYIYTWYDKFVPLVIHFNETPKK